MSKRKTASERAVAYRVANPRGIPAGRHVLAHRARNEAGELVERVWFEGDVYDGPVTERFLGEGFLVEVTGD